MTNPVGAVLGTYSFLPFGGTLSSSGSAPSAFQFVGAAGVMGQVNDLLVMRSRLYDSTTGSFTTPDPLGLRGVATNLYTYADNNPVQLTDPSGNCPFCPLLFALDAFVETVVVPAAVDFIVSNPELVAGAIAFATSFLGDTGLTPTGIGDFIGNFIGTLAQGKNPFEFAPSLSDIQGS